MKNDMLNSLNVFLADKQLKIVGYSEIFDKDCYNNTRYTFVLEQHPKLPCHHPQYVEPINEDKR
jgi:hypothetical protein